MTNEEAKALYADAVARAEGGDHAAALALLDELEAARPNSRHVAHQRCLCLAAVGRVPEARAILATLQGKLDQPRLERLETVLADAESASTEVDAAPVDSVEGGVFSVEAAYPVDAERSQVSGRVVAGVIRSGDVALVTTPDGIEVEASILRIGPEATPANVVRAGQSTSLLLEIEPQYVSAGMTLDIASRTEAYAATMVVDTTPAQPRAPEDLPSTVADAARQLRQGESSEAITALEQAVADNPKLGSAHTLLARAYLDAAPPVRDPEKALAHVRQAYELDGSEDPEVNDLLAQALAETGEAEHGLRFLERLYKKTPDPAEQTALAARIGAFRAQYGLGSLWQFADQYGEIVFEAKSPEEILKALQRNVVPRDAKCRFNRISEWRALDDALRGVSPEIAAVLGGADTGWGAWPILLAAALAAGIAGALVVILL